MKKAIMVIIIVMYAFLALSAQTFSFNNFLNKSSFSLLHSNKFSMHHSFTFSSSFSSNKKANYFSDYTNHINYKISNKLNLKMNLHFINYGIADYQNNFSKMSFNNSKKINVMPEFILDYSPSDNFHIKIMYNKGFNSDQNNYPYFR